MVTRNVVGISRPMLTEVALRNFKAFGDEVQSAPMSRITLLYGPNSGGKSSVIQALLLLKQSEGNLPRGAVLAPQGEYVDLAGFRAMTYKHDETQAVEINVKLRNSVQRQPLDVHIALTFGNDEQHRTDLPALHKVIYGVKHNDSTDLAMRLQLTRTHSPQSDTVASFSWTDAESSAQSYFHYVSMLRQQAFDRSARRTSIARFSEWDELSEDMVGILKHVIFQARTSVLPLDPGLDETGEHERVRRDQEFRSWERNLVECEMELRRRARESSSRPGTPTGRQNDVDQQLGELEHRLREIREREPEGVRNLREFTDHLLRYPSGMDMITRSYELFLRGMSYLGPILDDPRRFYISWGGRRSTVGKRGEYTVDIISYDDAVRNSVNQWFSRFSIPYRIVDVRNVAASEITGTLSAMVLEDTRTGTIVTPVDVGFGISQILPVIVEGVAGTSGIVFVDQPEVHLHPKLQAEIADLMVECEDKQWIVETHSELLVRRILRRIAEGTIKSTDVSVLYVDPPNTLDSGTGSTIEVLDIQQSGKFSSTTPWPDGFFEDGYREMMATVRAGG